MNGLTIAVFPDAASVSRVVASRMAGAILRALGDADVAHICLTGGRGGLAALTAAADETGIDWARVHVWWSDERYLPAGDGRRNDTLARAALLDVVGLPAANVHSMPDSHTYPDVDAAAQAYAEEMAAFGDPCPPFCVSILGIGEDGHVASLFPEHPALRDPRPAIAVRDSPKPPPVRISLSFAAINRADEVILIAIGSEKADAVGLLINDPGPLAVPAAGVHGRAGTYVVLDRTAARHLPPGFTRYA